MAGLVLAGDSAGGNLVAVFCAQDLAGRLPIPVLAQWLIYPSVDFLSQTPSLTEFAQGYLLTREDMDFFHGSHGHFGVKLLSYGIVGHPSAVVRDPRSKPVA